MPVDERHVDVLLAQRPNGGQASEAPAEDDDVWTSSRAMQIAHATSLSGRYPPPPERTRCEQNLNLT